MKISMSLLLSTLFVLGCSSSHEGVDLDNSFMSTKSAGIAPDAADQWSGDQGLPSVANQNPLGACQSFAMAGFLEYIYYSKTGQVADFSEKYLSYQLLKYMIDDFYDPATKTYPKRGVLNGKPNLGSGISAFMLDSALKTGVIPNAYYPYGDLQQNAGPLFLNLDLYNKTFENSVETLGHDEYAQRLDQAYLYPPTSQFEFVINYFDFAKAQVASRKLRSPMDFMTLMGLTKESFTIYHNSDLRPFFETNWTPEVVDKYITPSFAQETKKKNFKEETVDANTLREKIVSSLKRRMVVMVAATVWVSSWKDRLVYTGGGGHAMVIVGYQYQGDRLFFKLRNSWGPSIGVDGYDYVEDKILLPNLLEVTVLN